MSAALNALDGLREAFASKDATSRAQSMDKISDLFVMGAVSFNEQHVAVFDQVISLLANEIESRARARLSDKLADLPNAPPETIRKLARDEIAVARPVLSRSPRLTDKDLVEAARAGGRDHMLAISERKDLSEPVTDVLVNEGDRVVVNAVASNPTARFSASGYDTLVAKSRHDELLQSALGRRNDIPPKHMTILFELAKSAARERIQADVGAKGRRAVMQAVKSSAADIAAEAAHRSDVFRAIIQEVSKLVSEGAMSEAMIIDYCKNGAFDHAACALSCLAKLPFAMAERALASDQDLLLIVSRACNLGWSTVKSLLTLSKQGKIAPLRIEQLADSYAKLNFSTAQRVVRFLHARESAEAVR